MVYFKYLFWTLFWLAVVTVLHYTLPQHDIVRISDTYEKRVDFGENSIFWANQGTGEAEGTANRDVFFIQSVQTNNRVMVYRNEDTGWGWPPYFKFDTSNLQAESADLKSVKTDPNWAAIKHYGWRNEFLSIYPNAISVRSVEGPNTRIIPWFNIIFLTVLFAIFWAVRVRWKRFRENKINPKIDEWTDGWG